MHGLDLPTDHNIWKSIANPIASVEDINEALECLAQFTTCIGNLDLPEEHVIELPHDRHPDVTSSEAYREKDFGACVGGIRYRKLILYVDKSSCRE